MRRIAAIALMIWPVSGLAEGQWVKLGGPGIRAALDDQKLIYQSAQQKFYASGKTIYTQGGRESWGNWRVQSDQYCSQWPPNDLWACFDLFARGDAIRFRGLNGDNTDGTYADK